MLCRKMKQEPGAPSLKGGRPEEVIFNSDGRKRGGEGITQHWGKNFLGCTLSKSSVPRWASDGLKEQPGGSMAITGMSP